MTSTADAISRDSGEPWFAEGAWQVSEGVYRIPLPLPGDALRAVNVYLVQGPHGLTLIDGGWAVAEARSRFVRALEGLGHDLRDIDRFLVTHVHRDHYTLASVLRQELGADLLLGIGEKPILDLIRDPEMLGPTPFAAQLLAAGADDVAAAWADDPDEPPLLSDWGYPSSWLDGDHELDASGVRLRAVHTPGHTPGHFVFMDSSKGLLFAGDHVLPTITPSIGFTVPAAADALGDFMRSLAKVRALPDMRLLPAHGPVNDSTHQRVDELLAHHEDRLERILACVGTDSVTARIVAEKIGWTRYSRRFSELDVFAQGMAVLETRSHLDLLVARNQLSRRGEGLAEYVMLPESPAVFEGTRG